MLCPLKPNRITPKGPRGAWLEAAGRKTRLHLAPLTDGSIKGCISAPEFKVAPVTSGRGTPPFEIPERWSCSQPGPICLHGSPTEEKRLGCAGSAGRPGWCRNKPRFLVAGAHALRTPADLGAAQAAETGGRRTALELSLLLPSAAGLTPLLLSLGCISPTPALRVTLRVRQPTPCSPYFSTDSKLKHKHHDAL